MRLSEIGNKEIVDLSRGVRHGELWDAELLFDRSTGNIKAILVPGLDGKGSFKHSKDWIKLPWKNIVKIGEDMIIFQSQ